MAIKNLYSTSPLFLFKDDEIEASWYVEVGQCTELGTVYSREVYDGKPDLWQKHKNIKYADRLTRKLTKKRNEDGFY